MSVFTFELIVLAAFFCVFGYCCKYKQDEIKAAFFALCYAFFSRTLAPVANFAPELFFYMIEVFYLYQALLSCLFVMIMFKYGKNTDAALMIGLFSVLHLVIAWLSLSDSATINRAALSVMITTINILIMLAVVNNGDTYRGICRCVADNCKNAFLRIKAWGS